MKATILDLRYRMNDVLKALERNEKVTILYHGKPKGVITAGSDREKATVREHPFFGMKKARTSVEQDMDLLRGGRHRAL